MRSKCTHFAFVGGAKVNKFSRRSGFRRISRDLKFNVGNRSCWVLLREHHKNYVWIIEVGKLFNWKPKFRQSTPHTERHIKSIRRLYCFEKLIFYYDLSTINFAYSHRRQRKPKRRRMSKKIGVKGKRRDSLQRFIAFDCKVK